MSLEGRKKLIIIHWAHWHRFASPWRKSVLFLTLQSVHTFSKLTEAGPQVQSITQSTHLWADRCSCKGIHRFMFFNHFQSHSWLFVHQSYSFQPAARHTSWFKRTFSPCLLIISNPSVIFASVQQLCYANVRTVLIGVGVLNHTEGFKLVHRRIDLKINYLPKRASWDSSLSPCPTSTHTSQHTQRRSKVCWCWKKGCALHADGCTGSS